MYSRKLQKIFMKMSTADPCYGGTCDYLIKKEATGSKRRNISNHRERPQGEMEDSHWKKEIEKMNSLCLKFD